MDVWRLSLDGREIAKGGKVGRRRIRTFDDPVSGCELKLTVEGDAKASEVKIRLYSVDPELMRKVMAAEEPRRPPAPFERCCVLAARTPTVLTFMVKHPAQTRSLVLTPDVESLGGTPVVFRLAHSADGEAWTDCPYEYRLDNVAANPIAQTVVLNAKAEIKYVKLTAVRTLKEGCAATLGRLELVP